MKEAAASGRSRLILTAALASGVENIRTSYDISQISKWVNIFISASGIHSTTYSPVSATVWLSHLTDLDYDLQI